MEFTRVAAVSSGVACIIGQNTQFRHRRLLQKLSANFVNFWGDRAGGVRTGFRLAHLCMSSDCQMWIRNTFTPNQRSIGPVTYGLDVGDFGWAEIWQFMSGRDEPSVWIRDVIQCQYQRGGSSVFNVDMKRTFGAQRYWLLLSRLANLVDQRWTVEAGDITANFWHQAEFTVPKRLIQVRIVGQQAWEKR